MADPMSKAPEPADYHHDLEMRFRDAVGTLAGGAYFRATGPGMELELVQPIGQPEGDVVTRLLHHGWLVSHANGGGYSLSDEGLRAYLRSTDELGDGQLRDPSAERQP